MDSVFFYYKRAEERIFVFLALRSPVIRKEEITGSVLPVNSRYDCAKGLYMIPSGVRGMRYGTYDEKRSFMCSASITIYMMLGYIPYRMINQLTESVRKHVSGFRDQNKTSNLR